MDERVTHGQGRGPAIDGPVVVGQTRTLRCRSRERSPEAGAGRGAGGMVAAEDAAIDADNGAVEVDRTAEVG